MCASSPVFRVFCHHTKLCFRELANLWRGAWPVIRQFDHRVAPKYGILIGRAFRANRKYICAICCAPIGSGDMSTVSRGLALARGAMPRTFPHEDAAIAGIAPD